MELLDYISEILNMQKEDVLKNSKKIDDNLTYYWNPIRGGRSILVDSDGNYLVASSAIGFSEHLDEFKKGDKNKNFNNE